MDLQPFRQWLQENGITLHDGISVVETPGRGVAVVAIGAEHILHPQTVVSIPKSAILSVRSCALAEQIRWEPYGHSANLALAFALYSEILSETQSKWFPYLQTLPATPVPIARLWGDTAAFPDDLDSNEAQWWLHGTEIQRELQDAEGYLLMDQARTYYKMEVQPLLDSMEYHPTLQGFLHAYSLVCSRAFLVDAYHGLSMVPVADAFNHTHENHVQLASEYDVCPTCGSLSECTHDGDSTPLCYTPTSTPRDTASQYPDTVDMVTVGSIAPGAEVFNTYGSDLGNAQLLARYGFALEGGDTDAITVGWPGSGVSPDSIDEKDVFRSVYVVVREELKATVQRSALLFVAKEEIVRGSLPPVINSDGQTALALFIWAVMQALSENPPPELAGISELDIMGAVPRYVPAVVRALLRIEDEREGADPPVDEGRSGPPDAEVDFELAEELLAAAAEALSSFCRTRIAGMGKKGYRGASAFVLGDILDSLPPAWYKTRVAIGYLLSERALLETCAAGWEELMEAITGRPEVDEDSDMEL
ncbi:SET domain-containing protein [Lenzites betulinus]|nr:SET domain-containing protein [Lenzites betulinus]